VTISSRRQALFKGKARFEPARFIRYLQGEEPELTEAERKAFEDMAYAYRYYFKLVSTLRQEQVTSLWELIRLVNLELRGKEEEARQFVRAWVIVMSSSTSTRCCAASSAITSISTECSRC
jgi:hypothetical protein